MSKNQQMNNTQPTDLNEDVQHLYKQFNNSLQRYHEIHFSHSVQQVRKKWPLLVEIGMQRNQ